MCVSLHLHYLFCSCFGGSVLFSRWLSKGEGSSEPRYLEASLYFLPFFYPPSHLHLPGKMMSIKMALTLNLFSLDLPVLYKGPRNCVRSILFSNCFCPWVLCSICGERFQLRSFRLTKCYVLRFLALPLVRLKESVNNFRCFKVLFTGTAWTFDDF